MQTGFRDTLEIELVPGRAYTLAQPFIIEDNGAPVVGIGILNAQNQKTAVTPAAITIDIYDATQSTVL